MKEKGLIPLMALGLLVLGPLGVQGAWGYNSDSILLKDIEVLTLYSGKMTAGSRSSPVPQLQCVKGGTASCDAFRPRVVQCYNRGFDGVDVQWECKADMDNAYRFGEIEVSCEGYSHRDDPYVLRGSCGLRYSLDYTKEGLNQQQGHNYYGSDGSSNSYGWHSDHSNSYQTYGKNSMSKSSTFADLIVFIAVGLMLYAFYKTCCSGSRYAGQDTYSTTSDDYPAGGGGGGYGWFGQGGGHNPTAPPPPTPGYGDNASCRNRNANAGGGGGGGFWTGAAAGGLLGYMFGNRGNNYAHYGGYQRPRYGGSSWFGGGGGGGGWNTGGWGSGGGGRTHHSPSSTGTRTASGFGGTSRR